jgi:hypothetical protein
VHASGERVVPFLESADTLTNVRIQREIRPGPWAAIHAAAIREADVVLIVGGAERSEVAGYMAHALGKPVLGIPLFEGSGETLWHDFTPNVAGEEAEIRAMGTLVGRRCRKSVAKVIRYSFEFGSKKSHFSGMYWPNGESNFVVFDFLPWASRNC